MFKHKEQKQTVFQGAYATNTRRQAKVPKPQMNKVPIPDVSNTEEEIMKQPQVHASTFQKEVPKEIVIEEAIPQEKESTVITRVTMIKGDLEVEGNMTIYGEVEGNVSCGGELRVYGIVHGNIETRHFFAKQAEVVGNIQCEGKLIIAEDTSIEGNIIASSMILKGKVMGDIQVDDELFFHTGAHVEGDVAASCIAMEKGTFIRGFVKINSELM